MVTRTYEEALPVLEQAIQMTPEDWDAYFWKGMTCASMGQDEEAIVAIERSLTLRCRQSCSPLYAGSSAIDLIFIRSTLYL